MNGRRTNSANGMKSVRGKNIRLGTIGVKPINRYVTTASRRENTPTRPRIGDKKRTLAKTIRESSRSETSASARNKARHRLKTMQSPLRIEPGFWSVAAGKGGGAVGANGGGVFATGG